MCYICIKQNTMKEVISLRLEQELVNFLKEEAKNDFRNLNNYVEMVLQKHMNEVQKQKNPDE